MLAPNVTKKMDARKNTQDEKWKCKKWKTENGEYKFSFTDTSKTGIV